VERVVIGDSSRNIGRTKHMTHKHLSAAAHLAAIAVFGCATTVLAIDLTKLPPASTKNGVTFDKDIQPIFKANCVECHGAQRPKNNLRLDSLEGLLRGSRDGQVIVPGKSDKSDLVISICWEAGPTHPMPPKPQVRRGGRSGVVGTNAPAAGASNEPPVSPGGPAGAGMANPVRGKLTPEQIGLVRAWIDQGAK
jgi:hypothetical protein